MGGDLSGNTTIFDAFLELFDALIDPSFLTIISLETLGSILVIGVALVFVGLAVGMAGQIGGVGAVAVGLMLTVSLFSSPASINIVAGLVLLLATVIKIVSGAAFGRLLGFSPLLLILFVPALFVVSTGIMLIIGGMQPEFLVALKIAIVVVAGISVFELLSESGLPPIVVLGVSVLIAAIGLVDLNSMATASQQVGVVSFIAKYAYGIGIAVGAIGGLAARG